RSSDISAIASAYPPTSRYRDSPISSGKPLKPDRPEICPGYLPSLLSIFQPDPFVCVSSRVRLKQGGGTS
ncbi:hypothetical protein, partial [Aquibium sp. ELW1220]|uniref:hypothetical protein n=1 Tax=Aquibium sp. ELW1220 TaxID=2976766 RepID=UPI0025B1B886